MLKKRMTTKLKGEGGVRALVVGPLKKNIFCGFPKQVHYFIATTVFFSFFKKYRYRAANIFTPFTKSCTARRLSGLWGGGYFIIINYAKTGAYKGFPSVRRGLNPPPALRGFYVTGGEKISYEKF